VQASNEQSRLDRIEIAIEKLTKDVDELRQESKDLGTRFGYYQQSTQAIVNLAFSLVASATVSVFITTILKR
jgi:cell division septum initiation protein DivIVA